MNWILAARDNSTEFVSSVSPLLFLLKLKGAKEIIVGESASSFSLAHANLNCVLLKK